MTLHPPSAKAAAAALRRSKRGEARAFQSEMAELAGKGLGAPGIQADGSTPGNPGKMRLARTCPPKSKRRTPARTKLKRLKPTRKRLVARLDAIFSLFVRLRGKKRTGGACELCDKRPIEVCFHWVSRGNFATRWDPGNAVASCKGDNYEETFRKQKFRDMHIASVGVDVREALEAKARNMTHFTDADLEAMAADFKARMEAGRWE